MKLNKIQGVILVIGVIIFIGIGVSYFYSITFNFSNWYNHPRYSQSIIGDCIKGRKEERIDSQIFSKGRVGESKEREEWLKPENDLLACTPKRPPIISMEERPIPLRQYTIVDTLFSYFSVGIVLGLLLFLVKDVKHEKR